MSTEQTPLDPISERIDNPQPVNCRINGEEQTGHIVYGDLDEQWVAIEISTENEQTETGIGNTVNGKSHEVHVVKLQYPQLQQNGELLEPFDELVESIKTVMEENERLDDFLPLQASYRGETLQIQDVNGHVLHEISPNHVLTPSAQNHRDVFREHLEEVAIAMETPKRFIFENRDALGTQLMG